MLEIGYAHRPVALGRGGMVASAHPFASLAGVEALKAGGTAADAAVAVNAVLAVTQPYCCGVGGDFFCLYYDARSRRVHFLNGAGRSGSRATLDELTRHNLRQVPRSGPASVSVPGCVRAWGMLLERFGTRGLVSQATAERTKVIEEAEWRRIFVPDGRVPATGDLLRQPDLALTLRALGEDGPDLFYRGEIAEAMAARLDAEGFVTAEDLAAPSGEWGGPLATDYRGFTVYQTPPPTQGLAALLALNLLEGFDLGRLAFHSAEHLHLLVEMIKLAYADRDRWIADPSQSRVPVAGLGSEER